MFGVQSGLASMGAPAAAAMARTCPLIRLAAAGGCPTVRGQMPLSQRASFPASGVGAARDFTKPASVSRNWASVILTLAPDGAGACAEAGRRELRKKAEKTNARTMSILIVPEFPSYRRQYHSAG